MKELLFSVTKKDFDITWFSGRGAGGQHRNKHQNCCRIVHRDSGAMGTGQSQRDRVSNQKEAFLNCINSVDFKVWHSRKVMEYSGAESIESIVDKALDEKNLKTEVFRDGKWEELTI